MREFLIRRIDGDWFDLDQSLWPEVMRPRTPASEVIASWGDHRIRVQGVDVSFSYVDPGIQVAFEGDIDEGLARRVVEEIFLNIEGATGQRGRIVDM